jgi:hypothetical protein
MTHRRKDFIVYPPNYKPLTGRYKIYYSKFQAWKAGIRLGEGATVVVSLQIHPAKHTMWISSSNYLLWEIVKREQT